MLAAKQQHCKDVSNRREQASATAVWRQAKSAQAHVVRTKITTTSMASMRPKLCTAGTGEKTLAAKAKAEVVLVASVAPLAR